MPLQPKFLDHANAQILLIGHQEGALEKVADLEPKGEDEGKDKPLDEMEKLEDEDQIRIEHLKGKSTNSNISITNGEKEMTRCS